MQSVEGSVWGRSVRVFRQKFPGLKFVAEDPYAVAPCFLEHVSTINVKSGIVDESSQVQLAKPPHH